MIALIAFLMLIGRAPLVAGYDARSALYYKFSPSRKQRRDGAKEGVTYIIIPAENEFTDTPDFEHGNRPVYVADKALFI